ncbi:MATE family efflux transporter [Psychrilyobacter atlanticus]|uniref:MATE family efflux transporter n=1 Tax=Psychrilyobacter atlanticus TaxID=271091 RepID=UPI0004019F99|nr:MATE family efflux transporter [Psychrilyobacter atlanticus]
MNKEWILKEEKIPKALLKLSLPAVVGILISAIYNVVDTLFVGMLNDTRAIGAIAVSYPLFMLIAAIGQMIGVGGGNMISRFLGAQDKKSATTTFNLSIALGVVFSIVATIFGVNYLEWILKSIGATPTILPYAKTYTLIIVLGTFFTVINMVLNNTIRAEGNSKYSMCAIGLGAILNIILDPIFIFVLDYGIEGAAVATVISQFISTLFLFKYYFSKSSLLKVSFKQFLFKKSIFYSIIIVGLPSFSRQILVSVSMAVYNNALQVYGDTAIAAGGIAMRVVSIIMFTLFGFAQGFQPLVAYSYGQKNYSRIVEALKVSLIWVTIYSIVLNVIYIVFSENIIKIFSFDPQVIKLGQLNLYSLNIFFFTFGITTIVTTLYQSLGKGRESFILASCRNGFFFIPLVYILNYKFGLNGIIATHAIADLLAGLFTLYYIVKIKREMKKIVICV